MEAETELKAGQTRWVCLCCDHEQISTIQVKAIHYNNRGDRMQCDECGQVWFKAVETKPTVVNGCGSGGNIRKAVDAGIGLGLLMVASADSPYDLVQKDGGWAWEEIF